MGAADTTEKILEAYDDVFADIMNALLFAGRQAVKAEDLIDAQPFSAYKLNESIKWQERDVSKYWKKKQIRLSCFGIENQTRVDYKMPIRAMSYDTAEYCKQLESSEPYYPVITLVLHFGTEQKWTAKKSLIELLGDRVDRELLPYINDYKLNVFDLAWLTDEEISRFKSDFKLVVEYLRAERTGNVENWDRQKLAHIHAVLDLLQSISHDDIFTKMEDFIVQTQRARGGVEVSEFVQKWLNQGRNEGISIGRNEGILSMTALMSSLYAQGRDADVKKAMTDSAYLKELMANYQMQ